MMKLNKTVMTSLGLVSLAGAAGVSGYFFNILVVKVFGLLVLGKVLTAIGIFTFMTLPATLFILPVAKWSIQTVNWQQRFRKIRLFVLVSGLLLTILLFVFQSLISDVLNIQSEWLVPLFLWLAAPYLQALQVGVLMGRRSYWLMGLTTAIPVIGKAVILVLFLAMDIQNPIYIFWSVAVSGWIAVAFGYYSFHKLSAFEVNTSLPTTLWPTGWVTLTTNAWITWDTALAGFILVPNELSAYAIIAIIGKVPYQLAQLIANIGINESGWEKGERRKTHLSILLTGMVCLIGTIAAGKYVLQLFGLREGLSPLLIYMSGSILLAHAYMEMGASAQKGRHNWPSFAVALMVWTLWVLLFHPSLDLFVGSYVIMQLAAFIGIWLQRHSPH